MASASPSTSTPATTSTSTSTSTPPHKSSAAYLKRREQVRRAQRTHRERKESYVHALESEVLGLRARARGAEVQNDALRREVAALKSRLDARWDSRAGAGWDAAWVAGGVDAALTEESRGVEVQWLGLPGGATVCEREASGGCSAVVRRHGESMDWSVSAGHAEMAMEFVLTLEKPCVQRAQSVVFDPLNAYPVDQTVNSTELALYHSFVEDKLVAPGHYSQADVAGSLDNLLALSSAFCLDNEVTPVQAWQQLCGYLEFGAVDTKALRALVDALLEHVRCYGFGAVISKSVLDAACSRMFTVGT